MAERGSDPNKWAAAGQSLPQQTMPSDATQQQQQQRQPEEFMQVVYQSDPSGSLVGVESALLGEPITFDSAIHCGQPATSFIGHSQEADGELQQQQVKAADAAASASGAHQQLSRASSTLPPVAEESTLSGSANSGSACNLHPAVDGESPFAQVSTSNNYANRLIGDNEIQLYTAPRADGEDSAVPIYSTVNKQLVESPQSLIGDGSFNQQADYANLYGSQIEAAPATIGLLEPVNELVAIESSLSATAQDENAENTRNGEQQQELNNVDQINEEISHILVRQKQGAAESGSFRHNFRKKLGISVSTNENDLTAHRQKLFESREAASNANQENDLLDANQPSFKRNPSVSFNVNSGRSNRHSVDIRNLPSYLTHKRASIVDVAKGAMSSLINSLGGGSGGGTGHSGASSGISSSNQRRDSNAAVSDDEPIFEEPIAPTLSLGQRVALVQKDGAEFGTVGWIGQLPDVDDDWIVGVLFDNKIGNCDGAYKGIRYFYARENYAMFVPLTALTKTDNYIGRPETGTMLSRMSVSLKPGQLISIQRSSIRLQHCFLNAPHQRVGHDVRAVSNRLHCQCHNCGPCAHLTKQGNRINVLPHFGAHHLPHRKKNSLAHAAVEMLAHHHHHFHEEEEHDEKDYEFGDNAAHACNYVRYSCCQQNGVAGHTFMSDCEMVRPELLDNLIHAPKAPHRRSTLRRARIKRAQQTQVELSQQVLIQQELPNSTEQSSAIDQPAQSSLARPLEMSGQSTLNETMHSSYWSSEISTENRAERSNSVSSAGSSSSACSTCSPSPRRRRQEQRPIPALDHSIDMSSYRPTNGVYSTLDSQISIMDQRRFIFQRDSSAFTRAQQHNNEQYGDDADSSHHSGIGRRILRCLGCLAKRESRRRGRRGDRPKRKLSARDRLLEYRRRQSTFVPSTLAKPHEDFASHGIMLPTSVPTTNNNFINSDYSSYSRSSNSSSRSSSPGYSNQNQNQNQMQVNLSADFPQQQQSFSFQHGDLNNYNQELKSCCLVNNENRNTDERQLDYGDFTFDNGYESYKKNDSSKDSALADLSNSEHCKHDLSSDTLKSLVDQSINEQVELPEPFEDQLAGEDRISPVSMNDDETHRVSDLVEISSPTVSEEDSLRNGIRDLNLESHNNDKN